MGKGSPPASRNQVGTLLVVAQLGLIGGLALLAAPPFVQMRAPVGAWLLAAAGALLGLWALAHNRPGNFNIRPTPRADGHLVHSGPYRWIRHPMYTAILACALACIWAAPAVGSALVATALLAVLVTKALLEERWMLQQHPAYAAYCQRTRRFLPGLV